VTSRTQTPTPRLAQADPLWRAAWPERSASFSQLWCPPSSDHTFCMPSTLNLSRLGLLAKGNLVSAINLLGATAIAIYVVAMLIHPWFAGEWDWRYVQDVWDRWQALNVGVLAFLSSLIAFNITGYNASRQRERDFIAARAFLPSALSELIPFFKESARVFRRAWETNEQGLFEVPEPTIPDAYRTIFAECIRHASPEVGDHLSKILVQLQIHSARLRSLLHPDEEIDVHIVSKHNLITYLYRVGELQALVGNLFDFARGESDFRAQKLEWEDFRNAFGNLNIDTDDFVIDEKLNLKSFIERRLAKQ
jgi:hypothetical protein